ncbi:MAG: hypothetical protein R2745_09760 [Vicinamibacterales bacterium]
MKYQVLVLIVAASMLADVGRLAACGDKFLGAGRGPRFSRVYAAIYPGRLVLYTPARGDLAGMRRQGLDKALRRAGHQVAVVTDREALARALEERAVDVVVVDAPQVSDVAALAGTLQTPPSVLPVTRETINFLKTVDDTMKTRIGPRLVKASGGK